MDTIHVGFAQILAPLAILGFVVCLAINEVEEESKQIPVPAVYAPLLGACAAWSLALAFGIMVQLCRPLQTALLRVMHGGDDPKMPIPAGLQSQLEEASERTRTRYLYAGQGSAASQRMGGMDPYQQTSNWMQTYFGPRSLPGGIAVLEQDSVRQSAAWTGASGSCCGCCRAEPSSVLRWHAEADDLTLCGAYARFCVLDPHPVLPRCLTAALVVFETLVLIVGQPVLLYYRALQVEEGETDPMPWGETLLPLFVLSGVGGIHLAVSAVRYCQWANPATACSLLACLGVIVVGMVVGMVGAWLDHGDLVLGGALVPLLCVLCVCCLPPVAYACLGAWVETCGCCCGERSGQGEGASTSGPAGRDDGGVAAVEDKADPAAVLPRYNPVIRERVRVRKQIQAELRYANQRSRRMEAGAAASVPSGGEPRSSSQYAAGEASVGGASAAAPAPVPAVTPTAWLGTPRGGSSASTTHSANGFAVGRDGQEEREAAGLGQGVREGARAAGPSAGRGLGLGLGGGLAGGDRAQRAARMARGGEGGSPQSDRDSRGAAATGGAPPGIVVQPPTVPRSVAGRAGAPAGTAGGNSRPRGLAARLALAHGAGAGEGVALPPTPVGSQHTVPASHGSGGLGGPVSAVAPEALAVDVGDDGGGLEEALDLEMQARSVTAVALPLYTRGGCCGASWDKWLWLGLLLEIVLAVCLLVSLGVAAGPGTRAGGGGRSQRPSRANARLASLLFLGLIVAVAAAGSIGVGITTLRMRDSMAGPFSGLYGGEVRRVRENNKGSLEMQADLDREAAGSQA